MINGSFSSSTRARDLKPRRSRISPPVHQASLRIGSLVIHWCLALGHWTFLCVLFLAVDGHSTVRADPATFSPAERVQLNAKLRSPQLATRLEVVERLAQSPGIDAAKLLIDFGLRDSAELVQQAAYSILSRFGSDSEIAELFRQRLLREAQSAQPSPGSPQLLRLLLSDARESQQTATREFIDQKLVTARHALGFAMALAEQIGTRPERNDVRPLLNLLHTKLGEPFALRRSAVIALSRIDAVEAVDAMIALLPDLIGEVRLDALEFLTLVTQKNFTDSAHWAKWWAENKAGFQFPWPLVRPKGRSFGSDALAGEASYYGLPIYAKRVVFILDGSASMSGGRLAKAQDELIAAVARLASDVRFGIVVFNSDVLAWRTQLVPADLANKEAAFQFVRRIVAQNNTASYGALQAALSLDAEAIYFLTDGVPTTGRLVEPDEIVAAVSRQNRHHRQSIYTIGVGVEAAGSKFDLFLRSLAEENTGAYRRIESQ